MEPKSPSHLLRASDRECLRILLCLTLFLLFAGGALRGERQRLGIDDGWRFSLGHATDRDLDFGHAKGYFSYHAKTGFGDGPASFSFDDRMWRRVDLPHDWAIEMPFDPAGSHSHGYKAVGPGFPEHSVGWYRRSFEVSESDLGRRIWIEFDGIYRDADVFVNGFFVGNEPSGYLRQAYDVTDYLNYGGRNVVAVRVDASMEEGWYYEGAGIYRHAWLDKHDPVHLERDGVWVRSEVMEGRSRLVITTEVTNSTDKDTEVVMGHVLRDASGTSVASVGGNPLNIKAGTTQVEEIQMEVERPRLWDLDDPYLYALETRISSADGRPLDSKVTRVGIRSIVFDPDHGFFLNGRSVKLKGTNNHQDHAGVGVAFPDALQDWRIEQLKRMGSNAYRTSHHPPAPELLDACDRLGMLVIDETRLMGSNPYHLDQLERLIRRDRNHPSVILWSLGNEEWGIEGNVKGERITRTMQDFARKLDPTRMLTVAISGGWGGISKVVEVMGVNYIQHGDTDRQHAEYPWQVIVGTEETTTQQTRGVYFEDKEQCHLPPLEHGSSGGNAESGWQHYASRDYAAGVFYWTGFDYRGEPTPYGYPAISSQFGILDTCGFPKDGYYYLKSWWTEDPVLHIFPHWNWAGREGELIEVRVHSNCRHVELFLNGESLGLQSMSENGHLFWMVPYHPGSLVAKGITASGETLVSKVETTGFPHSVFMSPESLPMENGKRYLSVVKVGIRDEQGRLVPDASSLIRFKLEGVGRILGVGNGNPSSHEADQFVESVWSQKIGEWNAPDPSDPKTQVVYEGTFDCPKVEADTQVFLLINALGTRQEVLFNGSRLEAADTESGVELNLSTLKPEGNRIRITATPYQEWRDREGLFQFHPAALRFERKAPEWNRSTFNGLAQVLVLGESAAGPLKLVAESDHLLPASVILNPSDVH
ncbi:MAG: DUF4982 domain-containing protein [Opitutales bacterium]|nr:DUF4982 domain-containing protein [Opitutales bacterium]